MVFQVPNSVPLSVLLLLENMQQDTYEMLNKTAKPMISAAAISHEMQTIIRTAAEPWAAGDSIKAAIDRAARRTGLNFRRVRTLWYCQTTAIAAVEADTLRAWHRGWLAKEHARLTARLAELETEWNQLGGNE